MNRYLFFILLFFLPNYSNAKKIKSPEGFVFIPSGTIDRFDETFSCQAFWMSDHEVTNGEYVEFLSYLLKEGKTAEFEKALPDTSGWTSSAVYNQPYAEYYLRHPAYKEYPVVNVSAEAAQLYCIYLTEKLRLSYGQYLNDVRLPTKYEWTYAACGDLKLSPYPWGGPYLRNSEGEYMANYRRIGDENIYFEGGEYKIRGNSQHAGNLADASDITSPVRSYKPNGFGLYNTSGNVAEICFETNPKDGNQNFVAMGGCWNSPGGDIQVDSYVSFTSSNPFAGFRPVITYISPSKEK